MQRLWTVLLGVPAFAIAASLTPAWVELGPGGQTVVRVVVNEESDCPAIALDGGSATPMRLRTPVPKGFRPACEFEIPAGAKKAVVGAQALVLPVDNPSHVAVIGDTGCRIKGARIQACNDPEQWPFARVAEATAKKQPQLVVHVGDYLYREAPCPAADEKLCGGSPSGDNWEAWNADFFTPAAKLLAAAPWAFSRGNHESCSRSWQGWFYYLDPRPFPASCDDYSEPYVAKLGTFQLLMVDSSAAKDAAADPKQVARYTALLAPFASTDAWLVEHHPLWGLKRDSNDKGDAALTAVMQQAFDGAKLSKVSLVLAGHTHLFEILSFSGGRPPQIVAGDAGTALAGKIQKDLKGETVFGTQVASGASRHEFGLTLLDRKKDRWDLTLKDPSDKTLISCRIQGNAVQCKGGK